MTILLLTFNILFYKWIKGTGAVLKSLCNWYMDKTRVPAETEAILKLINNNHQIIFVSFVAWIVFLSLFFQKKESSLWHECDKKGKHDFIFYQLSNPKPYLARPVPKREKFQVEMQISR